MKHEIVIEDNEDGTVSISCTTTKNGNNDNKRKSVSILYLKEVRSFLYGPAEEAQKSNDLQKRIHPLMFFPSHKTKQ